MLRPPIEVADVFAAHADAFLKVYGDAVSSAKRRVLRDLVVCRTAALGGHLERCDECGHERPAYDSCRNRHCPKCQAAARAEWLEARATDLLPVEYFHVVFTVPPSIAEISLQNKKAMYDILMRAAAETLKQIAADPKHLGAKIGFLSVLHTWGQNLHHHPHVHCVVPAGGLSLGGERWVACRPSFFLPVRVLSSVFRGKFLDLTRRAFADDQLQFQGALAKLEDADEFAAHLKHCYANNWVVYAKRPFGGPAQVLKYLARYTHRVAISNHRLVSLRDGQVQFRWKDYARGSRQRVMTIDAVEFIRRFLFHVLPKGFVRIRQYGLLANRCRVENLVRCRELLAGDDNDGSDIADSIVALTDDGQEPTCPACGKGTMLRIAVIPGPLRKRWRNRTPLILDSS
jgi:hypothetical protein